MLKISELQLIFKTVLYGFFWYSVRIIHSAHHSLRSQKMYDINFNFLPLTLLWTAYCNNSLVNGNEFNRISNGISYSIIKAFFNYHKHRFLLKSKSVILCKNILPNISLSPDG